jgi:hypothetical protein
MKLFKSIREFFWPLMDRKLHEKPKELEIEEIVIADEQLPKTLEYAMSGYNAQEERRKTIEGKSSLFVGTISVVTSVVIGISTTIIKSIQCNPFIIVLYFLLFILTVYLLRTIWFSIKVLEREAYHTLTFDDFNLNEAKANYYKEVITIVVNYTKRNSWVINRKVDNMVMAQEYFKRAIVTIGLCAVDLAALFTYTQLHP